MLEQIFKNIMLGCILINVLGFSEMEGIMSLIHYDHIM